MDTGKLWNMYNVPFNDRPDKYEHRLYENNSLTNTSDYQDIYNICFRKDIVKVVSNRIDKNNKAPDNLKISECFIDKIYNSLRHI